MTMQAPSKSVSEIVSKIAEAMDTHLGGPAWRGNASVKRDGSKIIFVDNAGEETVLLDLADLVASARGEALTSLSYDPETKKLSYTAEDAQKTVMDLSGLGSDVHVSGGSYDPETMRLTLKDQNDETPDVIIDFSGLVVHLEVDKDGSYEIRDGRGLIGRIDTRRKIEVIEHRTGELWVNGQPIVRSIFDVSNAPDGSILAEGVALIVRQYGACSDGVSELFAPQDHDGNSFHATRSVADARAIFRRSGNFAAPRAGEWIVIEYLKAT